MSAFGGYTCSGCGQFILNGIQHTCSTSRPVAWDRMSGVRIAEALERIARALEHLADRDKERLL